MKRFEVAFLGSSQIYLLNESKADKQLEYHSSSRCQHGVDQSISKMPQERQNLLKLKCPLQQASNLYSQVDVRVEPLLFRFDLIVINACNSLYFL